jgi:parallel beta-helix repeat protein
MKKILLLVFVLLLLLSVICVIHFAVQVKAEPKTIYVDSGNVGDPLEDGSSGHPFDKIQEGVDIAVSGDTVFAYGGTYYEWNVVLDKDNFSLVGENRDNTVIDGMNSGWILTITAKNATITGFTIQKSSIGTAGVFLNHAVGSKISNNIIKNHDSGIYSAYSNGNVIENNWVSDNYAGMILSSYCGENRISNNVAVGNTRGIDLSHHAHHNEIRNNKIFQNTYGFSISYDNNSIFGNQIVDNHVGIYEDLLTGPAEGYRIYHNNFINNTKQTDLRSQSVNIWDNGLEGNYWSDYNGSDFDQDGIGDISKVINANNTDHFPLMGMFSDFPVTWEEKIYHTTTVCNSSIAAFEFDQVNSVIRFNVTGEEGLGFCRVCIPHDLMDQPYTVIVDAYSPQYVNYALYDNGSHSGIYFTYLHSTREVMIIPEFPTWTSLLLLFIVVTVAIAIHKRRPRAR